MGIVGRIISLFQGYNWLIIPAALFAIIFHELSHGLVAYALGDTTAKRAGRLSLNPLKHIDPIGAVCMVIFGFGWAKPVPVNSYFFKHRKLGMSLVALAGPVSNLIMATVAILAAVPLGEYVLATQSDSLAITLLLNFLFIFAILNVGLAVFNLIPIPPLDGSKILFALLPDSAYGFILKYEQFGMLVLIVLINIPFFSEILTYLRSAVYEGIIMLASVIFA